MLYPGFVSASQKDCAHSVDCAQHAAARVRLFYRTTAGRAAATFAVLLTDR